MQRAAIATMSLRPFWNDISYHGPSLMDKAWKYVYNIYILIYICLLYIILYIYTYCVLYYIYIHIMCLYFVCTYTSTVSICIWHDVTILYVDILVHIEIHYSYYEIARLWIYCKGFKHDQTNGCDPVYNQLQSWAPRNLSVRCLWDSI